MKTIQERRPGRPDSRRALSRNAAGTLTSPPMELGDRPGPDRAPPRTRGVREGADFSPGFGEAVTAPAGSFKPGASALPGRGPFGRGHPGQAAEEGVKLPAARQAALPSWPRPLVATTLRLACAVPMATAVLDAPTRSLLLALLVGPLSGRLQVSGRRSLAGLLRSPSYFLKRLFVRLK